jgi:hypothetical protein
MGCQRLSVLSRSQTKSGITVIAQHGQVELPTKIATFNLHFSENSSLPSIGQNVLHRSWAGTD